MPVDAIASPPEINSARLISGAGMAPLQAAATGYSALSTAFSVGSGRTTAWLAQMAITFVGDTAMAVQARFAPYVGWLTSTSLQLGVAASRAQAQVGAYGAALAAMPTLAELAALQTEHATLVATNPLVAGLNTPAIVANEAAYAAEWVRAAAVQSSYFAATVVNSTFEAFTPSPLLASAPNGLAEAAIASTTVAATATPLKDLQIARLTAHSQAQNVQMLINAANSTAQDQGNRANRDKKRAEDDAATEMIRNSGQTALQAGSSLLSQASSVPSQAASLISPVVQQQLDHAGVTPGGFPGTRPDSPTLNRLNGGGGAALAGAGAGLSGALGSVGIVPIQAIEAGPRGMVAGVRLPTAWTMGITGAVPTGVTTTPSANTMGMVPPPMGTTSRANTHTTTPVSIIPDLSVDADDDDTFEPLAILGRKDLS